MTTIVLGLKTRNFVARSSKMPVLQLHDIRPMNWKYTLTDHIISHHHRHRQLDPCSWNDEYLLSRLFEDHPNYTKGKMMAAAAAAARRSMPLANTTTTLSPAKQYDDNHVPDSIEEHDKLTTGSYIDSAMKEADRIKYIGQDKSSTCSTESESEYDDETDSESVSDLDSNSEYETATEYDESDTASKTDLLSKEAHDDKETEMAENTTSESATGSPTTNETALPTVFATQGSWQARPCLLPDQEPTNPSIPIPPLMPCMFTKKQLKAFRPWMADETAKTETGALKVLDTTAPTAFVEPVATVVPLAKIQTCLSPDEMPEMFSTPTSLQRALLKTLEEKKIKATRSLPVSVATDAPIPAELPVMFNPPSSLQRALLKTLQEKNMTA